MSEDVPRVYRRGVDCLTLSVISCWDCEFGFECAAERATRCLKLNESACEFGKNGVQSANGGYALNRPNPTEAVDTRRHNGIPNGLVRWRCIYESRYIGSDPDGAECPTGGGSS